MAKLATMIIMMLMGARYFTRKLYAFFKRKGLPSRLDLADGVLGLPGPANKQAGTQCTHRDHQTVSEELHKVTEDGVGKTILESNQIPLISKAA